MHSLSSGKLLQLSLDLYLMDTLSKEGKEKRMLHAIRQTKTINHWIRSQVCLPHLHIQHLVENGLG